MSSRIEHIARQIAIQYTTGHVHQELLNELTEAVKECDENNKEVKDTLREKAVQQWQHDGKVWHNNGELEIDKDAVVSLSEENGAYVSAWVWVNK